LLESDPFLEDAAEALDNLGRMVAALHEAGAPLILGTDVLNSFVLPAFSVHKELRLLVEKAGLTPFESLILGTTNAAAFLGLPESFGTVAVGRCPGQSLPT